MLTKRLSDSVPGTFVYRTESGRVVCTAMLMRPGLVLVYGPQDTIVQAQDEIHADRIALRFAMAL